MKTESEKRVPLISVEIYEAEPPRKYRIVVVDHRTGRFNEIAGSRLDWILKWAAEELKALRKRLKGQSDERS